MVKSIAKFLREEDGNAVEYALIVGLIGLAVATAVGTMNTSIGTAFTHITTLFNRV